MVYLEGLDGNVCMVMHIAPKISWNTFPSYMGTQHKIDFFQVLQATAEFLGGDEECWMELQSMVTRMGEGSLKR